MTALNYIIAATEDGEFQIWTPDQTGAIIGQGPTEELALLSARGAMTLTIKEIEKELEKSL